MPYGKYSHHLPRSSPPPGNLTLPGARPGSTRTEERNPLQIPSHHITGSIHRSAWKGNSRKFVSSILHRSPLRAARRPSERLRSWSRGSTCCGAGWICRIFIHRGFICDCLNCAWSVGRTVAQQQQSRWRPTRRQVLLAACVVGVVVLILLILLGYAYAWTGFGQARVNQGVQPAKTLWDWLQLLIIPAVLAGGGLWFNRQQQERQREDNLQQQERERVFAERRSQEEALQAYLDGMSQLLADRDRPLHRAQLGDSLSTVARAQTLTVLTRLDGERKGSVVRFLYDSGLMGRLKPIKGSKRSGKVDSIVDLRGADLRGINLH